MASINALSRELVFKLVYYGPGLSGKTTSLQHLYATAKPEFRGKMVSLATPVDRTLYFDFLPLRIPHVRGMTVRLQLFTVPGQVHFNATRKLVLTGADGVVFVSDSQPARMDANLETLENLRDNLREYGRDIRNFPHTFQHNKRDLPDPVALAELEKTLNLCSAPSFPTVATTGEGIYEGLDAIVHLVVENFERGAPAAEHRIFSELEAVEGGLADALRNARPSTAPPSRTVVESLPESGSLLTGNNSLLPGRDSLEADLGPIQPILPSVQPAPIESTAIDVTHDVTHKERDRVAAAVGAPTLRPIATQEVSAEREQSHRVTEANALAPAFSMAELWPESDRSGVRAVEDAIRDRRHAHAVELCDGLVSRVLASAAMLLGSADAPRDPSVVALLLGIDGRRYLAFRELVRNARTGLPIDAPDALAAFAFAAEIRVVRASL